MVKRLLFLSIALLLIVPLGMAAGQGEVKGRLTDSQGRGVPGTTIVFRNTTTGTEQQVTTDQNGGFVIMNLEPGRYALQTQTGPNTTGTQISVDVSGANTVEIVQEPNGQLEVKAETHAEDRSTANIQNAYDDLQIELLPQPNDINKNGKFFGPYNLSLLSEGVTTGYIFQNGVGPSVGGRPNTSNNFHVDGIDNNNQAVPGPLVTVTNEAVTDFTLMQGQQFPQFGHTTGGQMNAVVADGSNQWHGGIYDYWNNRKLNAVEPVLKGGPLLRYDQNRLGGKVGGPIMKNNLFVFGDFEYIPLRAQQPLLNPAFAPTAAGFAALAGTPAVSTTNLSVLQNNLQVSQTPITTTTVRGVTVPLGLVNSRVHVNQDQYNGIANLDWNMKGKSALGLRYVHNDLGTNAFGFNLPGFTVPGHIRSLLGAVNYTATPSTDWTFNLNFGYNRLDQRIGGGSFVFPGLSAFPNITVEELGLPLGSRVAIRRALTNMYHGSGSADWRIGSNDIRFGGDVRWVTSVFRNFGTAAGTFGYSSLERFLLDLPPDVGGLQTFGGTGFDGNRTLVHPFVQDSFRFSGVDIELGLGYEYSTIPSSLTRQARLNPLSVPGVITFRGQTSDKWNFEPRAGFAWSPGSLPHTVVRGGFGISYDALYQYSPFLSPDMTVRSINSALLNTPGFLASGGAAIPTTAAGGVGIFLPNRQKTPYIEYYNGALSHAFAGKLAVEVKYMGHHGVNLPLETIFNASPVTATNSLPVFFTNPGPAVLDTLTVTQSSLATTVTPFTAAGFTNPLFSVSPSGNSWYNAGVFKVQETFTAGTQVVAQYTYQELRSDATGTPLDLAFGQRWDEALWNQKHRFTITPIIDVASMLPQSTGILKNVIANLSIMGTATYARGPRFPLFSPVDTGMIGTPVGTGLIVNPNGNPGLASGVTPLTNSSGQVVAFEATDPNARFVSGAPGTFSNAHPVIRLSDIRNVDVSVVKRFSIPERAKLEIRGDAYNLGNHPQFTGLPVSTLGSANVLTPSFLVPNSSLFGKIDSTLSGNPRVLQFAVRVLF
jgi:hypothetical protein